MAGQQGAHHHTLSSSVGSVDSPHGNTDQVPDVFSVVAQESLLETAQPAFKHSVKVSARWRQTKSYVFSII